MYSRTRQTTRVTGLPCHGHGRATWRTWMRRGYGNNSWRLHMHVLHNVCQTNRRDSSQLIYTNCYFIQTYYDSTYSPYPKGWTPSQATSRGRDTNLAVRQFPGGFTSAVIWTSRSHSLGISLKRCSGHGEALSLPQAWYHTSRRYRQVTPWLRWPQKIVQDWSEIVVG